MQSRWWAWSPDGLWAEIWLGTHQRKNLKKWWMNSRNPPGVCRSPSGVQPEYVGECKVLVLVVVVVVGVVVVVLLVVVVAVLALWRACRRALLVMWRCHIVVAVVSVYGVGCEPLSTVESGGGRGLWC